MVNGSFLKQGEYVSKKGKFKIKFWIYQTLIWIGVNILSKIVLSIILYFIFEPVYEIAQFLLKPFGFSEVGKLLYSHNKKSN